MTVFGTWPSLTRKPHHQGKAMADPVSPETYDWPYDWPEDRRELRLRDQDVITVCSSCLRAACWLGLLMCEQSKGASTVGITVQRALRLNREHPSYWLKLRTLEGA